MKKDNLYFMVVALMVLNLFTLFKLNSVENSLDNRMQQNANSIRNLENDINNIYTNVETTLKKEASIIDNYNINFGEKLNSNDLTVPVTISITPKEYSDGMNATLQLNDASVPMSKNGLSFVADTDIFIFDSFSPKVILEQNGVQKIETIEDYSDIQMKYILQINGGFGGTAKYDSGKYKYVGTVNLFINGSNENNAKKISVVSSINGNVTNEKQVDMSKYISEDNNESPVSIDLDEKVELAAGDKFMMYANIQDIYGIDYKYVIRTYEIDSKGVSVNMYPEWSNGSIIKISDKNGNVLYVPEYFKD